MIDHDYEVFISYRHKPANALAERLYREFQDNYSVNSFRDSEELHFGDFRKQLIRYNKKSRYLVLLLTPGMLDRCNEPGDWITTEISLFLKKRKPIIPILIDGFEFPEAEMLPEEIRGLLNYKCNAFSCCMSNINLAAARIAKHVYSFLRKKWSPMLAQMAINEKDFLSRHRRDEVGGYFYFSALDFRKYLFLFGMQLLYVLLTFNASFQIRRGMEFWYLLFAILSMYLVHFEIKEYDDVEYDHPVSFVDIMLDFSIFKTIQHLYWGFIGWILPFIGIGGVSLLGNVIFSSMFGDGEAFFTATAYTLLILPLIRLGVKLILSFLHLLNSLFSHYPYNFLREFRLQKTLHIAKIVGWCLYGPAIIFCNWLAVYVSAHGGLL